MYEDHNAMVTDPHCLQLPGLSQSLHPYVVMAKAPSERRLEHGRVRAGGGNGMTVRTARGYKLKRSHWPPRSSGCDGLLISKRRPTRSSRVTDPTYMPSTLGPIVPCDYSLATTTIFSRTTCGISLSHWLTSGKAN